MELRINDYVRTEYGIAKIIKKLNYKEYALDSHIMECYIEGFDNHLFKEDIIKSSPNIIDLIEVDDLIRIEYYSLRYEERVTRLFEVTYKDKKNINLNNSKCDFMLIDGDFNKSDKKLDPIIKSIVTKEQISQMEYKIGDE